MSQEPIYNTWDLPQRNYYHPPPAALEAQAMRAGALNPLPLALFRNFSLLIFKINSADADVLIEATCLSKCNKLITGNIKHFDRIENLDIENWIRSARD